MLLSHGFFLSIFSDQQITNKYGTQLYESTDDMAHVAASFHRLALHVRGTGEDHEPEMDLFALSFGL